MARFDALISKGYCIANRSGGLKAQISKIADIVSKTAEVVLVIEKDQITESLIFVKIFQHRTSDDVPSGLCFFTPSFSPFF